ncbi:thiamine-phosphate kinase [Isoptericola dokdonensis]|uniref:Thiamine-monophosphate kinase n=1 Tax=Isoptericola dokdonensis DS-3 TaxID=1300344 RepID=A0A168E8E9_9MICO|nr:thiamine-phosphate kinase [Isoptericola dokdonensis]ANC29725.1 Thiamine-monophosphate kinase [Isoptericola dokdonensis DS-3]
MTDPTTRVHDLDETELLARIFPLLPTGPAVVVGPGDDAAVVRAPDGRFVVTTDVLVQDRHFRRDWSTGYDVGRRAAVQNLADVAAMGAHATSLVVSLVVPGDLEVDWVTGLARGLAEASAPAAVVGGDLSGGDAVVVSVTVHGDLAGRDPVLRSGARPGDVVAHAGTLGTSAAGLDLLTCGAAEPRDGAPDGGGPLHPYVSAYLRPRSPLAAGPAAAAAGATAMLDVSDGLLRDAGRLARAGGVTLDIARSDLGPDVVALLPAAVQVSVTTGDDGDPDRALRWVLAGGEDHGLLATFPAHVAATGLPAPFRPIGVVTTADDAPTVLLDGEQPDVAPGWDHFRP